MKRALVLSGGGSKGAYEAGFIKAMHELNIDVDIVTGTSIGALNGALVTMGMYDELDDLWNKMNYNTVFKEESDLDLNVDLVLSNLKSFINHKGADITPLKQLIRDLLDEERFLSSSIHFGLITTEYPRIKQISLTKDLMEKELIADYLIASASAFPIFPIHYINEIGYIDGGYSDNLPIDLALDMGADEVIIVDLKQDATHPYYINRPHMIYTTPPCDLGPFLDFSKERLERNKRLGYLCGMKTFDYYVGNQYTLKSFDTDLFKIMYKEILKLERNTRTLIKNDTNYIYNLFLENNKQIPLKEKDYLYIILDWFLELMNRDLSYVYDYHLLLKDLLIEFDKFTHKDFKIISLNEITQVISKKELIGRFYHGLLYPEDEPFDLTNILRLFPKEIIMAYFLFHIKNKVY